MKTQRVQYDFLPWLLPVTAVISWEILSRAGVLPSNMMPAPSLIVAAIMQQAKQGELLVHIGATTGRVLAGFMIGLLAATAFGILSGCWPICKRIFDPSIQTLRSIPSMAWVPVFILWLGIYEASKITLISVGVFFPVYLNLMSGIEHVDKKLYEVGQVFGLSRIAIIVRIIIPAVLPTYLVGIRTGLSNGWMFVVAAELMGASKGLGFLMIDGQMTGRPSIIFGSILVFAVLGKSSDILLANVQRRIA